MFSAFVKINIAPFRIRIFFERMHVLAFVAAINCGGKKFAKVCDCIFCVLNRLHNRNSRDCRECFIADFHL